MNRYDGERALALLREAVGVRDAEFHDGQDVAIRHLHRRGVDAT